MALEEQLEHWVAAGVITVDQADRIRTIEGADGSPLAPPAPSPAAIARHEHEAHEHEHEHAGTLVAEVFGYGGLALACAAIGLLVAQYWGDLDHWARLVLVGFAVVVVGAAGLFAFRAHVRALDRFGSVLWFLAAAGVALWSGLFAVDTVGLTDEDVALAVGLATAVAGLVGFLARPKVLQHLALFAGCLVTTLALVGELRHPDGTAFALALWGLGAIWALFAWGDVLTRPSGYLFGLVTMFVGAGVLRSSSVRWSIAFGLVTAAVLLGASVWTRSRMILAVATLGTFVWVAMAVEHNLPRSDRGENDRLGPALVLFAIGLLLVGIALVVARARGDHHRLDREDHDVGHA